MTSFREGWPGCGKCLGRILAWLPALRHRLAHRLRLLLLEPDRALACSSEAVARFGGQFGVYVRQHFYRHVLEHVGRDVYFGFMSLLSKRSARIGDRVYIGRFCVIGRAVIGDGAMLADGVHVPSGRRQHLIDAEGDPVALDGSTDPFETIVIGPGAWIGTGAVVMADVGARAVVGAGAVVVKPVPPGGRVAGVPARAIGSGSPAFAGEAA